MYGFCSRQLRLSNLVYLLVAIEKAQAYYKITRFSVNYEYIMFYGTGPGTYSINFIMAAMDYLPQKARVFVTASHFHAGKARACPG
jgi:hypothetical protein